MIRLLTFLVLIATAQAQQIIQGPPKFPLSSAAASTLNTSLISYWKLDEASGTRVDSEPTGTPQDLTDNNTVTSAAGIISNAGDFLDTNNEYLSRADSADLSVGNIDFTFNVWVRYDTLPVTNVRLIDKESVATEYRVCINSTGPNARFTVWNPAGSASTVSATTFGALSAATWYMITAWHDAAADTINIAVNAGAADTAAATSTGVKDSTSEFDIGGNATGEMDGRIDEAGFWKKVLTADERTELYNAGVGKTCCPF